MQLTLRVAVAVVVIGLGLQPSAEAGFRRFRSSCMNCGQAYSAPVFVASPAPVCACGGSAWNNSAQAYAGSTYPVQPSATGSCCGSVVSGGLPQTGYSAGYGSSGYGSSNYGGMGIMPSYQQGSAYGNGGFGYGAWGSLSQNYARMPAQYTPYTPTPIATADDLVW